MYEWFRYDPAPLDAQPFVVQIGVEDTAKALRAAQDTLIPWLMARKVISLDFRNIPICTQSFLHALLYEPLRIAWALRIPVHVENVEPGVRSNLQLLESYALGG